MAAGTYQWRDRTARVLDAVRRMTRGARIALGFLVPISSVAVVLLLGFSGGEEPPGIVPTERPICPLTALYVAHLTLTNTRDLGVQESITIRGGPRRSFTRALATYGWKPGDLFGGPSGYVRSAAVHAHVSAFLPAQRTNRFAPPKIEVPLPAVGGRSWCLLRVILHPASRIVLDAPRNAIGDTFPAANSQSGPGDSTRTTMQLPDFRDPVEFDLRSPPFRNPILVQAANVTVWTPFGWLLALAIPLVNDRVRDLLFSWVRRRFHRSPQPRTRQKRLF
jgi:hypothetical protein